MAKKKPILGSVNLDYVGDNFEWYAIVTMFNYEEFYVDNLIQGINGTSLEPLVDEFFVPITKTLVNSYQVYMQGQKPKITKSKDAYSFYVFIRCKLTEELWCFLRETTGVAVIPTVGGIPQPVPYEEIYKMKCKTLPKGFLIDWPSDKPGSLLKELRDNYEHYVDLPWKRNGEKYKPIKDTKLKNTYERMTIQAVRYDNPELADKMEAKRQAKAKQISEYLERQQKLESMKLKKEKEKKFRANEKLIEKYNIPINRERWGWEKMIVKFGEELSSGKSPEEVIALAEEYERTAQEKYLARKAKEAEEAAKNAEAEGNEQNGDVVDTVS